MLDQYRGSFLEAYLFVVESIREQLNLEPRGRHEKTSRSICEKLRRESIRLSQIQDIAGCRIVVDTISAQEEAVQRLCDFFEDATVVDRRDNPSHSYRAVHVIVRVYDRLVEIQVRTTLQHMWAQLSELLADRIDPALKYGRGPEEFLRLLTESSSQVSTLEANPEFSRDARTESSKEVLKYILESLNDEFTRWPQRDE